MSKKAQPSMPFKQNILEQKDFLKKKRRTRRIQVRESFACECGKIYLTFSALYLHAKIKHNLKLTTQSKSEICRMEQMDGFCKYVYLIWPEKEKENVQKSIIKDNPQEVKAQPYNSPLGKAQIEGRTEGWPHFFGEYLNNLTTEQGKYVVKNFINFGLRAKNEEQMPEAQKIRRMPYRLNSFVLDYLPMQQEFKINSEKETQTCKTLQDFCQWLRQNNLTDLQVVCNFDI